MASIHENDLRVTKSIWRRGQICHFLNENTKKGEFFNKNTPPPQPKKGTFKIWGEGGKSLVWHKAPSPLMPQYWFPNISHVLQVKKSTCKTGYI